MASPSVTAIVPLVGTEPWALARLDSLLNQTLGSVRVRLLRLGEWPASLREVVGEAGNRLHVVDVAGVDIGSVARGGSGVWADVDSEYVYFSAGGGVLPLGALERLARSARANRWGLVRGGVGRLSPEGVEAVELECEEERGSGGEAGGLDPTEEYDVPGILTLASRLVLGEGLAAGRGRAEPAAPRTEDAHLDAPSTLRGPLLPGAFLMDRGCLEVALRPRAYHRGGAWMGLQWGIREVLFEFTRGLCAECSYGEVAETVLLLEPSDGPVEIGGCAEALHLASFAALLEQMGDDSLRLHRLLRHQGGLLAGVCGRLLLACPEEKALNVLRELGQALRATYPSEVSFQGARRVLPERAWLLLSVLRRGGQAELSDHATLLREQESFREQSAAQERAERSLVEEMRASRSWRITAPLRFLVASVRETRQLGARLRVSPQLGGALRRFFPPRVGMPEGVVSRDGLDVMQEFSGRFGSHRSGWRFALSALSPLHCDGGVFLDSFLERTYCWGEGAGVIYERPWVGFIHRPPKIPSWFPPEMRRQVVENPLFGRSLEHCRGLFTLSRYHKAALEALVDVPITAVLHPTDLAVPQWDAQRYLDGNLSEVVQVGFWLRVLHGIFMLPEGPYRKIYLTKRTREPVDVLFELEASWLRRKGRFRPSLYETAEVVDFLPDDEYDALLSRAVVFLDLYDASANNSVVECIARATPICVNPLPAVKEYLGEEYPLYYRDYEEAAALLADREVVVRAHEYLKTLAMRGRLTGDAFRRQVLDSGVMRGGPGAARGR